MRVRSITGGVVLLSVGAAILAGGSASADIRYTDLNLDWQRDVDAPREAMTVEPHAALLNALVWRSDRDFDETPPLYDESGQSVGALATVLSPSLFWHITPQVRLVYEVEIGLNYWSKNNPDRQDVSAPDLFVMKHRQLYAERQPTDPDGGFGFKVGYQRFTDPTGLFVNHWLGLAQLSWNVDSTGRVVLFGGQVPDDTHEGVLITQNNFALDTWLMGGGTDWEVGEITVSGALLSLYDRSEVERPMWLLAPALHVGGEWETVGFAVDAVFQGGRSEGTALGGGDQDVLAWAAQGHVTVRPGVVTLDVNVLAQSGDDSHEGNGTQSAFLGSAKNRSATILLTEDENRDFYDNVDERIAAFDGGFYLGRAGLFVGDVKASFDVDWFRPGVIVGAAAVLNPDNALGETFVGVEADVDLEFRVEDYLVAHVIGGALVPGGAGGALLNEMDRSATDPVWSVSATLMLHY